MDENTIQAVVFGNANLDLLCYPVNDVPRYDAISFEQASLGPGGCGSNVAIGLRALGVSTALVARTGVDEAAELVERYWSQVGLDTSYVIKSPGYPTGISVGLVDDEGEPRFIHMPGANALLTAADIELPALVSAGARWLHVAGFFVLPGLKDGSLPETLMKAQEAGLSVSLDVVDSPGMDDPSILWPCLPYVDILLCNAQEARRLTGEKEPARSGRFLQERGAISVIVKVGGEGCWLFGQQTAELLPATPVRPFDTTGAGDAFAAGLIAALLDGDDIRQACIKASASGRRMVNALGAVSGWRTA
ncbi:MAG: carbohydrate kinase family protein [Chloroflexota bacterium]|nr:MAG: carbohydrate kinase family protein [Chloroflexota bacterium]